MRRETVTLFPTQSDMIEYLLLHVSLYSLPTKSEHHQTLSWSPTSSKENKRGKPNSIHPIALVLMTKAADQTLAFCFLLPIPQGLFSPILAEKSYFDIFSL